MHSRIKTLHLFTAKYPYGKGESILENEIPVLAKRFDSLNIYPRSSGGNIKRELPANVQLSEAFSARNSMNTSGVFIGNFLLILRILFLEFIHCKSKLFFIKRIRHFNSLLIRAVYDASMICNSINIEKEPSVFYSYWMNDWALALAVLKHKRGIKSFVFRCGGFDIFDERHEGNYLPFRYFIYKNTSGIYPNAKYSVDYIKSKGFFPEKVRLTYLGTTDCGLNPFDEKSKFTLVSCSSLIPLKRVHLIVKILMNIKFDINWVHFGDGICAEEIKQLANKLPSNVQCEFKGNVPNQEILRFYKSTSVSLFITTSETESLPVSIQESISFGIPVLATDVGGISEIVNTQTGALINKNFDSVEVAAIINEFNTSKNNFEYRKNVRRFWEEHFSAELNYNAFCDEIIITTENTNADSQIVLS